MQPSNLVFIMADEHNASVMGCAGHEWVKTPRLDALAAAGTQFLSAYTPSPLCVPARAAMATGRLPNDTGYWDGAIAYDGRVKGWPHRLCEAGHRASSIGKLHYRDDSVDTGFSETIEAMHLLDGLGDVFGLLREAMPPKTACKRLSEELGRGDCGYLRYDRRIADHTLKWLEEAAERKDDKPFALFVSFVSPHYPLIAPPEFYDLYADLDIPVPDFVDPDSEALHPWVRGIRKAWPYDDYMDEEKRRIAVIAYYGMCSFMDANVGKVLDAIEATGLGDSTRVIYASDHGECLGNRGLWGKMTMYEDACRIPLTMAGPDIPKGRIERTPVSLIDIYPTVLDAVGIEPNEHERGFPGASLIDVANGRADEDRFVFSEYHGAGAAGAAFMIRHGRHKLIHYVGHAPELFDVESDPQERDNLTRKPEFTSVYEKLDAMLRTVLDPDEADARARADQAVLLERIGGIDAVLGRGSFAGTPAPGK